MDLVMTVGSVFAVFVPALMLPGPDFVAVVRSAMTRGSRAGLATALGVSLGLGFYAGLSLIGLTAILTQYQWLIWLVRILGGAYLVFLGLRLIIKRPDRVEIAGEAPRERSALLFGFVVTLTNPKAIVLFASVFATAASGACFVAIGLKIMSDARSPVAA